MAEVKVSHWDQIEKIHSYSSRVEIYTLNTWVHFRKHFENNGNNKNERKNTKSNRNHIN